MDNTNKIKLATGIVGLVGMVAIAIVILGVFGWTIYEGYLILRADFGTFGTILGGAVLLFGVGGLALFLGKIGTLVTQLKNRDEQG